MNKSDLALELEARARIPHKTAEAIVDMVFHEIVQALQSGDRVEIRGFGSFSTRGYEAYLGRNPRTGEPQAVAAKRLPVFKPGKQLNEEIHAAKHLAANGRGRQHDASVARKAKIRAALRARNKADAVEATQMVVKVVGRTTN